MKRNLFSFLFATCIIITILQPEYKPNYVDACSASIVRPIIPAAVRTSANAAKTAVTRIIKIKQVRLIPSATRGVQKFRKASSVDLKQIDGPAGILKQIGKKGVELSDEVLDVSRKLAGTRNKFTLRLGNLHTNQKRHFLFGAAAGMIVTGVLLPEISELFENDTRFTILTEMLNAKNYTYEEIRFYMEVNGIDDKMVNIYEVIHTTAKMNNKIRNAFTNYLIELDKEYKTDEEKISVMLSGGHITKEVIDSYKASVMQQFIEEEEELVKTPDITANMILSQFPDMEFVFLEIHPVYNDTLLYEEDLLISDIDGYSIDKDTTLQIIEGDEKWKIDTSILTGNIIIANDWQPTNKTRLVMIYRADVQHEEQRKKLMVIDVFSYMAK